MDVPLFSKVDVGESYLSQRWYEWMHPIQALDYNSYCDFIHFEFLNVLYVYTLNYNVEKRHNICASKRAKIRDVGEESKWNAMDTHMLL